jgi:hypothetical protein
MAAGQPMRMILAHDVSPVFAQSGQHANNGDASITIYTATN